MNLLADFRTLLLILLIICAVAVNVTKNLLRAVIIFMSYSSIMCIIWILLESPDLAITEAAVGAGISGVLFLMTLKRIRAEDAGERMDEMQGVLPDASDRTAAVSTTLEAAGTAGESDAAAQAWGRSERDDAE